LRLTVSQSVSLGVEPHLGFMTRYLLLFDSYGLVLWGALSDERTGLSFVYVVGPRQRSRSRVRVPWYSWPYFTVSDLRLPFSSPPTTRRVTVEVFEPASTLSRRARRAFYHKADIESHRLSLRLILILFYPCLDSSSCLPFVFSEQCFLCIFHILVCFVFYILHSPHTHWCDYSHDIWWRANIIKILIMQFYSASSQFPPSQVKKLSLSTLVSNILNLCSSIHASGQVLPHTA
jgi:hypothetical protein